MYLFHYIYLVYLNLQIGEKLCDEITLGCRELHSVAWRSLVFLSVFVRTVPTIYMVLLHFNVQVQKISLVSRNFILSKFILQRK